MLRKAFKIVLGMATGTALAYYFTSDRGRSILSSARERLSSGMLDVSRLTGSSGGAGGTAGGETQAGIEAKIEETRRRLREQLDRIARTTPEETDTPR